MMDPPVFYPMLLFLFLIPISYVLGSIPSSVWLGKAIRGIDLRDHGSGNAGTSNAFRILGWKIGILVLVLDILKGFAAVNLSHLQSFLVPGTEGWVLFRIGLGMLAVTGHVFPLLAGFRGGKGVATLAGVGLALHPFATLAALAVYLLVFLVSRISALGSLSAALSYPIWIIFVFNTQYLSMKIFSVLVTLVIILTHLSNIRRLRGGEEGKIFSRKAEGS